MINKQKNTNLQITISKDAIAKLDAILNEINENQIIKLSKSQAIEYLINRYQLKGENAKAIKTAKEESKSDYSKRLKELALKTKLSYSKLADKVGISQSTFKKYVYGYHEPTDENKLIIDKVLEEYKL